MSKRALSTDKAPATRGRKPRGGQKPKPAPEAAPAGEQRRSNGQFGPGNPYRWRAGESGNPTGARKGPRLSDLLHDALGQPMPLDGKQAVIDLINQGATVGQIIAMAVSLKAADGNLDALNTIADRTEGAPEQTVNVLDVTADDMAQARERATAHAQAVRARTET